MTEVATIRLRGLLMMFFCGVTAGILIPAGARVSVELALPLCTWSLLALGEVLSGASCWELLEATGYPSSWSKHQRAALPRA